MSTIHGAEDLVVEKDSDIKTLAGDCRSRRGCKVSRQIIDWGQPPTQGLGTATDLQEH
jgi:hypothetical protein